MRERLRAPGPAEVILSYRFLIERLLATCLLFLGCGTAPEKPVRSASAGVPAVQGAELAPPADTTGGFDGQKAYQHVGRLVAIGPRSPGTDGIRRAQEYIQSQLREFGCTLEEDDFRASTPLGPVAMKNIVAKTPGRSPNIVLLTTHYDTLRMAGFVGANDGGSSTGLMLEMARLLCARKSALTVWIAFLDGEEAFVQWSETDSTYGSRQLAAKLTLSGELKRVQAVMLADLIGDRNLRIKRESNSTRWLTDLVWSTAARLGYDRIFLSAETTIEDDHIPFLRRKIPAVDVIQLEIPYWHTTGDTLDKISPRSLATVGHVFLESLSELEKKFR